MSSERTQEWAIQRSRELYHGTDPQAEELLRAKCNWEHMTRTAVLKEWGDPKFWPSYKEGFNE